MGSLRTAPAYVPPPSEDLVDVHSDPDILIVNKPSGLLSVPGRGPEKQVCAISIAKARHGPVFVVHRLDMDTSGLLVLARTKPAQSALSKAFQARQVGKTYEAVVAGRLKDNEGEIDLPIARYSLSRPLRHIAPDGQEALTRWTVLERGADHTRLALVPLTGRSHQLRLHLSAIGHPILGDTFYGDPDSAPRLLLHATSLSFSHPVTKKPLNFETKPEF